MKPVNECPICFQSGSNACGEDECSKHGIPYDVLEEWASEQLRDLEEYYHDQIPVLQILLGHASDFVTRVKESDRMNDRLADTTIFLTNVREELRSYHLTLLEMLSNGSPLLQTGGEYYMQASDGRRFSWEEFEINPLRKLGYIQGTSITELGREAIRVYKTAHPLLFD